MSAYTQRARQFDLTGSVRENALGGDNGLGGGFCGADQWRAFRPQRLMAISFVVCPGFKPPLQRLWSIKYPGRHGKRALYNGRPILALKSSRRCTTPRKGASGHRPECQSPLQDEKNGIAGHPGRGSRATFRRPDRLCRRPLLNCSRLYHRPEEGRQS